MLVKNVKCSTPTKSTIVNNFAHMRSFHGHCPGALPAEFGTYGYKSVVARYSVLNTIALQSTAVVSSGVQWSS